MYRANPLRYFNLPSQSTSTSPLATSLSSKLPSYALPDTKGIPLFPHGGLIRSILESFDSTLPNNTDSTVQVSALLIYASEGDNTALAYYLADVLVDLLSLENEVEGKAEMGGRIQWVDPKSWEAGLRGPELGRARGGEMFG